METKPAAPVGVSSKLCTGWLSTSAISDPVRSLRCHSVGRPCSGSSALHVRSLKSCVTPSAQHTAHNTTHSAQHNTQHMTQHTVEHNTQHTAQHSAQHTAPLPVHSTQHTAPRTAHSTILTTGHSTQWSTAHHTTHHAAHSAHRMQRCTLHNSRCTRAARCTGHPATTRGFTQRWRPRTWLLPTPPPRPPRQVPSSLSPPSAPAWRACRAPAPR